MFGIGRRKRTKDGAPIIVVKQQEGLASGCLNCGCLVFILFVVVNLVVFGFGLATLPQQP